MHVTKIEERRLVDRHGRSRKGAYMHIASGRKYWPMDPKAEEVNPHDIGHHLACQGRYNGATSHRKFRSKIFYSVAEHSVYVADYVRDTLKRPDLELEALLHDGAEAYIGDLIRPMKYDPDFREPFKRIEELNEAVIAQRFNLIYPFPVEIKIGDEAVTNAEVSQMIIYHPEEEFETGRLHDNSRIADVQIHMMDPFFAREFFMQAFWDAVSRRDKYRELPSDFRVAA